LQSAATGKQTGQGNRAMSPVLTGLLQRKKSTPLWLSAFSAVVGSSYFQAVRWITIAAFRYRTFAFVGQAPMEPDQFEPDEETA